MSVKMETSGAVMIADVVKKNVVYSAECFDSKPLDSNTQLVVEYSVMAPEESYMPPEDQHDTIRHIEGAISVINGVLAVGSFVFPPAAPVLGFIAGVGSGIQFIMSWIPDNRPNEVVEAFKKLEKSVIELEKKMDADFADMKSFLTDNNFTVNITTQASTLTRFMRNCLKYQDEMDAENFKREYEKGYPLSAVYYMKSLLCNRSTNPLIMAMKSEKIKTKATFKKWKNTFTSILGEFLLIEAFASGLLGHSDFNQRKITKQWFAILKMLDDWEAEFKKDEEYWNEVQDGFVKLIESKAQLNNVQKAEAIKTWLDKYLTHDIFYICVFDETASDYGYYCFQIKEQEQVVTAWRKGRCNAFVYRSRTAYKMTRESSGNIEARYKSCVKWLIWESNLRNMLRNRLAWGYLIEKYGFYCAIGEGCHPVISYLNDSKSELFKEGPGCCKKMQLKENKQDRGQYWIMTAYN